MLLLAAQPLPMIQTYINLLPSSASHPLMLILNLVLLCLQLLTLICRVKFNTSKTQLLTISLSNTPSNTPIIFVDSEILPLNSVNILGLQISSSLSWRDHVVQIAKSASKKLGVLFRCKQYFNSVQLFKQYTGFIRPCLEYCFHIWSSSPYTSLLDRVESNAYHGRHYLPTTIVWNSVMGELIGSLMVSSPLLPAVGTLSLLLYFPLPSTFLQKAGLLPP